MRKYFCLILINICFLASLHAQKTSVEINAGIGFNNIFQKEPIYFDTDKKEGKYNNSFIIKPYTKLVINIPIVKRISLVTGIGYQEMGKKSTTLLTDTFLSGVYYRHLKNSSNLSYIKVPLNLSYQLYNHGNSSVAFQAGIEYCFLFRYVGSYEEKHIFNDSIIVDNIFTSKRKPVLTTATQFDEKYPNPAVQVFDVGLNYAVKYLYKKYSATIGFNHTIYGPQINTKKEFVTKPYSFYFLLGMRLF